MNPNTFGYMGSSSTYKTGLSHLVQRPLSNYQSHQNAGTVLITHFLLPFTLPFRTNLFILHKCCSGCHNFLKTVALLCPLSKIALYNMLQYLHNLKCIELKDNSEPHSSIESSCKKGQSLELQSGAHEWQTDRRFINKAIGFALRNLIYCPRIYCIAALTIPTAANRVAPITHCNYTLIFY